MHVEVVTNIIPTMNDDDAQLACLAAWVRNELGELTPWHVTRFYPHYHLQHLPPTPIETLEKAYDIGKAEGLRFIYTGNVPGHDKDTGLLIKQARNIGIKAVFLGGDGWSDRMYTFSGNAIENNYSTTFWHPAVSYPKGKQIQKDYLRKYGKKILKSGSLIF